MTTAAIATDIQVDLSQVARLEATVRVRYEPRDDLLHAHVSDHDGAEIYEVSGADRYALNRAAVYAGRVIATERA